MVKRDFVVLSLFNAAERWGGAEDFLEIAFMGRGAKSKRIVERNDVRQYINEFACSGYIIPDFSSIWCQALHKENQDVAVVSEMTAKGNDIYVV